MQKKLMVIYHNNRFPLFLFKSLKILMSHVAPRINR